MKKLFLALTSVTLLAGAVTAHAAVVPDDQVRPYTTAGKIGTFDPYTDGAKSVQEARDVYTDGAHGTADLYSGS